MMRDIFILTLLAFVLAGYPAHAATKDTRENGPKSEEQKKVFVGDMNFAREKKRHGKGLFFDEPVWRPSDLLHSGE